ASAPAQEQTRIALDDGEDVVEVVGDAAGQLAYGVHFLAAPQLRLEQHAICNVLHGPHELSDPPLIGDDPTVRVDGAPRAGRPVDGGQAVLLRKLGEIAAGALRRFGY